MTEFGETSTAVAQPAEHLKTMAENGVLTNGIITELSSSRWKELAKLLSVPEASMKSRISAVKKKILGFKKSINRDGVKAQLQSFIDEAFVMPVKQDRKCKPSETSSCKSCLNLLEANDDTQQRHREKLAQMETMFKEKISKLEGNIKDMTTKRLQEKKKLQEKNQKLKSRLNRIYDVLGCFAERKQVLRKIRRLKASRTRWREKYQRVNRKYEQLKKLSDNRRKRERNRWARISRACRHTSHDRKSSNTWHENIQQSVPTNESQSPFVNELVTENDTLLEKLDDITKPIKTMEGRQYAPAIREVSYYLQEQGVAESRVGEVIRTVSETVAGRRVGKLPSTSTQRRLGAEMKALSKIQVTDALQDKENLTLKYDGTTKGNLGHIAEVEIATGSQTYLLGMKQQPGGLASDYVNTITQCVGNEVLGECSNTMTDRCVTNAAVDAQLEDKLEKRLNKFRCGMHPLDSIGKRADAVLKDLDKERVVPNNNAMPFHRRGESSAQALIRAAEKLFNNAATGDIAGLKTFLEDRGLICSFPRWVGNRFNILFRSAALLSQVGDGIIEYFSKVTKPMNDLHRAFVNAWTTDARTDLRCLGIIHHILTGPWMSTIGTQQRILDANKSFNDALVFLEECEKDTDVIFHSDVTAFRGEIEDVGGWRELTKDRTPDMNNTLSHLLQGIIEVMKRQLASQLPDGEFWEPSAELQEEAMSCSPTNISGERNFAILDSRLHRAPNSTISKLEGKVMFSVNKTRQWLEAASPKRKRHLIGEAVRQSAKVRIIDREDGEAYVEAIRKRVRERQEKMNEKDAKERERIEDMVESIIEHGFITSENVSEKLESMSNTRACNVLRKQINFRKRILEQDVNKVALSKCSREELKEIVCGLPQDVGNNQFVSFISSPPSVIGQEIQHRWESEGRDKWYSGRVVAIDSDELKIVYDGQDEPFFMTLGEFLTDLYLQDLVIV